MLDIFDMLDILDMKTLHMLNFIIHIFFFPYGDIHDAVGILVKDVKLIKPVVPCVTALVSVLSISTVCTCIIHVTARRHCAVLYAPITSACQTTDHPSSIIYSYVNRHFPDIKMHSNTPRKKLVVTAFAEQQNQNN